MARTGATVLYVSGEESLSQIRMRAERINAIDDNLLVMSEPSLDPLREHISAAPPVFVGY